jgi:putative aminopeptidase FrvX
MPVDVLNHALPGLSESLAQQLTVNKPEPLWDLLKRLLTAHAPTGGANLLGGIGDDIAVLADGLGLRDRVISHLGSTGNAAIWLGSDKSTADLVVVAHMDRPSFRVRDLAKGELFPLCSNRFPEGDYRVPAKAVRFERGRLVVRAEGILVSRKAGGDESLYFEAKHGQLAWQDTILMDVHPVLNGDTVIGSGLDNSLGVAMALLTAASLRGVENILRERERRCLFVFTDQEEGPPEAFFGHGAARLMHAQQPPTYGCVIVDAQTAGPGLVPQLGGGTSHSASSRWGHGSIVPPNYYALAVDLAEALNATRPGTVQMNTGYLSRSDDMILGQWTRILGLSGPPMTDPHTGQESACLSDIQAGAWWLSYFLVAALNVVPELTPRYALGR